VELRTGTLVLVELKTGTLVLVEDRNSRSGRRQETLLLAQFHTLEPIVSTVEDSNSPTGPVPHSGAYSFDCSARDWDGKDYLRIIPRVVLVEDPRLT
jgi:hypothetical protein